MFDALKSIADGLLNTNRATFSDLIAMYTTSSAEELKTLIKQSEDKHFEREQQTIQQQIEADQMAQQAQQEFELEKQARDLDNKIQVAEISSFRFQADQDINNNQVPDQLEIAKLKYDQEFRNRKLDIEEKKLKQKK
jgi:hypothetical protein